MMDRSAAIRRAFHLSAPVWLVWYWMPPDAWLGVRKEALLVALLAGTLSIEAGRLLTGYRLLGLRSDESNRLSGFAWGALGLALALAYFPGEYVIPALCGMAWIDPLCAYARTRGGYPWLPLAGYTVLAAFLMSAVVPLAPYQTTPVTLGAIAILAPLAAGIAILVEAPNLPLIDDDFLMNIVPLVAMAAVGAALTP